MSQPTNFDDAMVRVENQRRQIRDLLKQLESLSPTSQQKRADELEKEMWKARTERDRLAGELEDYKKAVVEKLQLDMAWLVSDDRAALQSQLTAARTEVERLKEHAEAANGDCKDQQYRAEQAELRALTLRTEVERLKGENSKLQLTESVELAIPSAIGWNVIEYAVSGPVGLTAKQRADIKRELTAASKVRGHNAQLRALVGELVEVYEDQCAMTPDRELLSRAKAAIK